MIFTFGNLIVLLVVCALVILLRQYDRNNRTLNKVKKYADSARIELDTLVQERVDQMRDLTIGFEVHDKRGRALVARLEDIESQSGGKLDTYQQQLVHLDKKVGRAMDSISQLDAYHKTSDEKFSHFQKQMWRIDRHFSALSKNADSLEGLQSTLPKIVSEQRARFQKLIDEKYSAVEQAIAHFFSQHKQQITQSQELHQQHTHALDDMTKNGIKELGGATKKGCKKVKMIERALTAREHTQRKGIDEHMRTLQERQNAALEHARAQYAENISALIEKERVHIMKNMEQILAKDTEEFIDKQHAEIQKLTVDTRKQYQDFQQKQDAQLQVFSRDLDQKTGAFEARNAKILSETVDEQDKYLNLLKEVVCKLSDLHTESESEIHAHTTRLQTLASAQQDVFVQEEERMQLQINTLFSALKEETAQNVHAIHEKLEGNFIAVEKKSGMVDGELQQLQRATDVQISAINREVSIALDRAQRVQKTNQEQEQRLKNTIELHIDSFGDAVDKRVKEQFEKNIIYVKQIMDDASKLDEKYSALHSNYSQTMTAQSKQIEDKIGTIIKDGVSKMNTLQKTLISYATKIQKEQHLAKRQFDELAKNIQKQKQKAISSIQSEYQGKMQKQIEQLQSYFQKQHHRINAHIVGKEEEIDGRIETHIAQLHERIEKRIEENSDDLTASFARSTDTLRTQWQELEAIGVHTLQSYKKNEDHLKEQDAELQRAIMNMESNISAQKKLTTSKMQDLHNTYEKVLSTELAHFTDALDQEISSKRTDIMQRLERLEEELGVRIEDERAHLLHAHTEEIAHMIQENATQIEKSVAQERAVVTAQQSQICDDIKQSQHEIDTLKEAIQKYGIDFRTEFDNRYKNFQHEFDQKAQKSLQEAELSFKKSSAELRDSQMQFSKEQSEVITQIQGEAAHLKNELEKIDISQRSLTEQSKTINKAVALQKTLTSNIETLHEDIAKMEGYREETGQIGKEFVRIRDIAHKMQSAFDRISGERRKIDNLEKNWSQLNSLSDTVTRNIDKVHSKYDQVKELQIRMRDLNSLEHSVGEQYNRLEGQQEIIRSTLEGIDKNFDSLSEIEERMRYIATEIKGVPEQVAQLSKQVNIIHENNLSTEELQQQSKKLDKSIAKLEKRMNEVKGSQQWLGNLETRLQKMYTEVDEKLSVMRSLLQDTISQEDHVPESGSVPQTVKQLARKGWTPEQISNTLKISIGEIEVILGMATVPH